MAKNTSNKDHTESMLKGRMAESLVEELLKGSGNKVYRFGYESIVQNLTQYGEAFDSNTEVGEKIRAIPDFIVVNEYGIPEFVEVKFRWNGKPTKDDKARFEKLARFWNAPVVLIRCNEKPYFQVMLPPYFDSKGNFKTVPLNKAKGWSIDKKLYSDCEVLVDKYLSPTMTHWSKLIDPNPR